MKKTQRKTKTEKLEEMNESASRLLFQLELKELAKKRGITDFVLILENDALRSTVFSDSKYSTLYGLICIAGRELDNNFRAHANDNK